MSDFKAKCTKFDPLAGFKRPTSKGRGREGRKGKRGEGEREGMNEKNE